ncbi:hypothetical protein [Roseovarius aestuariivivens]|uniref:hypothetical protein n=1 Tax=Roseovarius aestuariivivens TaxID=1888910 RepID=UPI0010812781|nr:hypothetical protein [Roseovarius aestuariivivens]
MSAASDEDRVAETKRALRILLVVLVALVLWGVSVAIWGVPGLYIPALVMVPVLMGMLIWISRG